ncbi:formin-like protein 2 [Leptonychotes weddellii]|uniref:Formin-like protein 2 n=1 Tax=Leptonychotes weddellii TaxID=9713 RepID=A0A7F8RCM1_LEPWE|nr:formin-like protein 2 [Leptonychotes weddellii]
MCVKCSIGPETVVKPKKSIERFQVKNPPHTYIQKLKGYLDPAVTRKKFRRRVQESTQVLRELEISLRTNHIGWVREFLNEENRGLDVLVEYLSFAQYAVTFDFESVESTVESSVDKSKPWSRSIEDLHRGSNLPSPVGNSVSRSGRHSALRYNTLPSRRTLKNSRLVSKKDDVHVCIMCLRAIMNYQVDPDTLGALEFTVCGEKQRFEKLMEHFRNEDNNIDFMVASMQFINIVVHSVEDMNFRVHLQYEFTKLGLDEYLDKLKHTESDKLQVQIQAYLDNVFDVGALLEDAETKNAALERVEELEENISHLSEKLQDTENEAMSKIVELEKQLMQRNKELDVVREIYKDANTQVHTLRKMVKEKEEAIQRQSTLEKKIHELEKQGTIKIQKKGDGDISILPVVASGTLSTGSEAAVGNFMGPVTGVTSSGLPPPPPPLPPSADTPEAGKTPRREN